MKRYFNFLMITLGLISLASCQVDDAAEIPFVELGAKQTEFVIEADGGTVEIPVLSNDSFHIELSEGSSDWVSLDKMATDEKDPTITAECAYNDQFKRRALVVLCSDKDERRDTISIKQKGSYDAVLQMENASAIVSSRGGSESFSVKTNVPFELMSVETEYADENNAGWIEEINIDVPEEGDNSTLTFTTTANSDEVNPRVASVNFSFTDGWGDKVGVLVNLIQKNAKEQVGKLISFEEFLQGYSTGKVITDYVMIEGYVVSNKENCNAGEPDQKTTSSIDYTIPSKTVYIESLDGKFGASFLCATAEDNVFKQYDKVQLLLNGTKATLKEQPERVDVTGVKKSMVIAQVAGTKAQIPVKRKHLNELTPSDIYTYVTLLDVEIPVRKGSICPVNEGYAIGTGADRIAKYPMLIRDINGDASYLMTNTNCIYRSDGSRKPYGSGNMSGVIVHEQFSRFEWRAGADPADMADDPTLGYIGEYQLRHQTKEDIWGEMNDSVENSFSALLTEFRFYNPDLDRCVCAPTYGTNGWLTHTEQEKYTGVARSFNTATYKQYMNGGGTYDYLGPVGNAANRYFGYNVGNKNGCGIVLDLTKENYNPLMEQFVSKDPKTGVVEYGGQYATNSSVGYGAAGWSESNAELSQYINAINYNGSTSMRGKGNVYGGAWQAFLSNHWWDYETNRPYAWMINFSTAEVTATSHISMQFAIMNSDQGWYSPRYWCAEWSEVDSMKPEDDSKWHRIGEFTVPDVSTWSNTLYSSIVAFKHINFELPQEILGKENVYIRLMPVNDLCSSGAEYDDAHLIDKTANTNHANTLSYFAVRYNK